MAAIDGLLGILIGQGADALTLTEGQAPRLTRAGEPKPLSMPPLLPELLGRFIEEVRAAGDGTSYQHEAKGVRTTFAVEIEGTREIRFRRADAPGDAPPDARDVPAADEPSAPALPPATAAATPVADPGSAPSPRRIHAQPRPGIAPTSGAIADLIRRALDADATDLFVSTSSDARMRVGMELRGIPGSRLDESSLLELVTLDDAHHARLEKHGSVDLGLHFGDVKLRVNLFRHLGGLAAAVRPLRRVRTLAELGLPPDLEKLTEPIDGLVLLVGPTGSGKSSTIAALLDHVNRTRAKHILTIEDPVEYEYASGSCLVH